MVSRPKSFWDYATTRSGRTLAAVEAENRLLRDALSQQLVDNTRLVDVALSTQGFTLGIEGGAAALLAEMLAGQIEAAGAQNYLEIHFASTKIKPGERYLVTLQRLAGHTPHELRMAAERKAEAARREALAEVMALCNELAEHYSDVAATALLNGEIDVSNAASGEPRATRFIGERVLALMDTPRVRQEAAP